MNAFDLELLKEVNKSLRKAAQETMNTMGYNIIAENGWVVKVYVDGKKEKIKKID